VRKAVSAAVLLAALLTACGSGSAELAGYVREPLPDVGSVVLPDVSRDGEPFPMRADPGEVLIIYFGYTSCPDICPASMADVRTALGDLGDLADRVAVAMVTVDPDRDTPGVLTGYVQSFVPGSHALRSEEDPPLRMAADLFGASYDVTVADDGTVEVGHTASLYAVDDQGMLRVTWPFGTPADDLASDLRILLEG
jgi:protein SCO1/2